MKSHLSNSNIHDFKSLRDLIEFQKSYPTLRQQIISDHEKLLELEKNTLNIDLQELDKAIETQRKQSEQKLTLEINKIKDRLNTSKDSTSLNLFKKLTKNLKHWTYIRKIKHKEKSFDIEVQESISNLIDNYQVKSNRHHFITSSIHEAIRQSAHYPLSELERRKKTIDEVNSFIYGALGEQKVVKALETLPDNYYLINDFAVSFSPSIFNSQENNYIKSLQIDHILVAPSGIFLIETKNWSERSLENLSLRSPVKQIKRASWVLFKILNNEISNSNLHLNRHHWGDKKISIKNLIVLINSKPKEEFQFVKVVTLNELLGYINYFKPSFSNSETQRIADFLVDLNKRKVIAIN